MVVKSLCRDFQTGTLGSLLVFLALLLSSCGPAETGSKAETGAKDGKVYHITATVGMIADIVRQVAGDHAEVTGIIGEGVDPHLYKPTSTDIKALQSADVVFYNGLMLEGKMTDALMRVARGGKPVYAVTETILDAGDYVLTDTHEHFDPHVWMDVKGWIRAVDAVATALSEYDPEHADDYRTNAKTYTAQLEKLDAYATKVIGSIPEQQRVLVTAHDAFNYMGRSYGIEVRGIQGISTESEAGVRECHRQIDRIDEICAADDRTFRVRAKGGVIYAARYRITERSGRVHEASAKVRVWHDRDRHWVPQVWAR